MSKHEVLARQLEQLLIKESKVYRSYMAVIAKEQAAVRAGDLIKLEELTAKRAVLYDSMLQAQEQRLEIMRSNPGQNSNNLRSWIMEVFPPRTIKRLLPLAEDLRAIVTETQSNGREHKQIIGFALKAVNGVLSQIWSATEDVLNSYTKKGKAQQVSSPQTRQTGILKEA